MIDLESRRFSNVSRYQDFIIVYFLCFCNPLGIIAIIFSNYTDPQCVLTNITSITIDQYLFASGIASSTSATIVVLFIIYDLRIFFINKKTVTIVYIMLEVVGGILGGFIFMGTETVCDNMPQQIIFMIGVWSISILKILIFMLITCFTHQEE